MIVTAYIVGILLGIVLGGSFVYGLRLSSGGPPPPDEHDPWEDFDNPLHPYRSRDLDRL